MVTTNTLRLFKQSLIPSKICMEEYKTLRKATEVSVKLRLRSILLLVSACPFSQGFVFIPAKQKIHYSHATNTQYKLKQAKGNY